jgi:hypothetical protein
MKTLTTEKPSVARFTNLGGIIFPVDQQAEKLVAAVHDKKTCGKDMIQNVASLSSFAGLNIAVGKHSSFFKSPSVRTKPSRYYVSCVPSKYIFVTIDNRNFWFPTHAYFGCTKCGVCAKWFSPTG